MIDKVWDFIVDSSMAFFLPIVCSYFALTTNLFFNVACEEATGLEKLSNQVLSPFHYICLGKSAKQNVDGTWEFAPRFQYDQNFAVKTVSSGLVLVPSFVIGTALKTAAFLQEETRQHHRDMAVGLTDTRVKSNIPYYESIGLSLSNPMAAERLIPEGHLRRPGDEKHLSAEKEALRDITALLSKANIPWWIDCGTCLGAYRYGGAIPWDEDIDIAVLLPDFDNVCRTLNQLDPMKYIVQDWSSRDFPKCYLKVFIRSSQTLIDIYHFAIHPETEELIYILSLEKAIFFPDWWKIREMRFKAPVAFNTVFPLKKTDFDGIEVFVPNDTKKYLQRYYGENLAPAKVYDPLTGQYEKDLTHPYWQRAYVH